MLKRLVTSLSTAGAALLVAGLANAQSASDGEFSVQRFAPAPGPRNFVTVEGARTDGKMAWSAGLFANYSYRPFVVKSCTSLTDCSSPNAIQKDDVPVIESLATADVLASLTPMPKLQLGMRLPVTYAKGQGINTDLGDPTNAGRPLAGGVSGAGLGDLYLEAKLRAFGAVNSPFVLGAALFGTAPLGHATAKGKYLGDSSPTFGLRGIFDGNAGPFSFGANLAGLYRGKETLGSTQLGPEMRYGVAAGFRVSPVLRLIAEGFGATKLSAANGTNSLETDLSAQVTPLNSSVSIYFGGGTGVIEGVGVPRFRGFVGLMYDHEKLDTDGDGIADDKDQCPTAPEDFDKFQDEDGCPDPDNDGDDIADTADACPNTPGEKDPDPKKNGCPVVLADRDADGISDSEDKCPDEGGPNVIRRKGEFYGCPDSDKDGIPDKLDKCPEQPEDTDGYQDEDGCPDPDNDGDKILDQDDQCVDQPEVYNGFQDEDGCPDEVPDRDHDGIPDSKDKCPDKPENYNGYEDDDGCPDKGASLVQVTGTEIKILDSVNFATSSDKIIGKRSFEVLDSVAAVLSHHPEIFKVEVQGHTDNAGNHDQNVELSKRRAAAVVTYLTSKGIAGDRLGAQGYGPDKPIADNKTAKGRAKNRRVEFQIVQQSAKGGAAEAPTTTK